MRLLDRADELPRFARFHMDGTEMVAAIGRAVGRPRIFAICFPWRLAGLARPFVPLIRELHEMRYLWRKAIRLDNRHLIEFLGEEPRTPIDAAVKATLRSLGCLPQAEATSVREPMLPIAGGGQ